MEQLGFEGMPRRLYTCTPTRLTTWLDCPRRYRMSYLDRPVPPKGPPWAHNSLGASVHNALAGWWRLPLARRTVAAPAVAERDEAPVALHPKDRLVWREAHGDEMPEIEMEQDGAFEVSDVTLDVVHTPGHTPGSVSIYCEDLGVVFTGDALLATGPCPHEGGYPDFAAQLSAIGSELLTLPSETRVLPGHGEETTIAAAEKSFDSWVSAGPLDSSASGD